jgi:hypothetical protein
MGDLNIHQRINAVMQDCQYLKKEGAGQGKGVRYDEVIAMLRDHLIKHGIVMVVRQAEMSLVGEVKSQKVYQGKYEMDLINIDKPSDLVTHSAYAHGMDGGDKAPGKAHTYAVKIMLVKGFGIETGEDDESRSDKLGKMAISTEQCSELSAYCVETVEGVVGWSKIGTKLMAAYNIDSIMHLPASKFDEALERCKKLCK